MDMARAEAEIAWHAIGKRRIISDHAPVRLSILGRTMSAGTSMRKRLPLWIAGDPDYRTELERLLAELPGDKNSPTVSLKLSPRAATRQKVLHCLG